MQLSSSAMDEFQLYLELVQMGSRAPQKLATHDKMKSDHASGKDLLVSCWVMALPRC
jgi:hypothetical protein